jgi:hypothetical protein
MKGMLRGMAGLCARLWPMKPCYCAGPRLRLPTPPHRTPLFLSLAAPHRSVSPVPSYTSTKERKACPKGRPPHRTPLFLSSSDNTYDTCPNSVNGNGWLGGWLRGWLGGWFGRVVRVVGRAQQHAMRHTGVCCACQPRGRPGARVAVSPSAAPPFSWRLASRMSALRSILHTCAHAAQRVCMCACVPTRLARVWHAHAHTQRAHAHSPAGAAPLSPRGQRRCGCSWIAPAWKEKGAFADHRACKEKRKARLAASWTGPARKEEGRVEPHWRSEPTPRALAPTCSPAAGAALGRCSRPGVAVADAP